MVELCHRHGDDPDKIGVGRASYLIGGRGRPLLKNGEPPLEWRFRHDPMPLSWFDHPAGHAVFRAPDPEHWLLRLLCGKHLAGWANHPTGAEMFRILTEGARDDDERLMVNELLADIRPEMYPQLRRQDALSIWHIARAAIECQVQRGALSWWLNQFALKPPDAESHSPVPATERSLGVTASRLLGIDNCQEGQESAACQSTQDLLAG